MQKLRSVLLISMFLILAGCTSKENRDVEKFIHDMVETLSPDITEDEIRDTVKQEIKNLKLELGEDSTKIVDDIVELIKDARKRCC